MNKTALIYSINIPIAFNMTGRQILEYHSKYDRGKDTKNAPQDVLLGYFPDYDTEPGLLPMEEW